MKKIYIIHWDSDVAGAWGDPISAVKWFYNGRIRMDGTITLDGGETWHTVEEIASLLRHPDHCSRYYARPFIEEIILDPLNYNDVWHKRY